MLSHYTRFKLLKFWVIFERERGQIFDFQKQKEMRDTLEKPLEVILIVLRIKNGANVVTVHFCRQA